MSQTKNFLMEIGVEELPTQAVSQLSNQLKDLAQEELTKANLSFAKVKAYGAPRRIALFIEELASKQEDFISRKKGPSVKIAFDAEGKPTKALEGFARSNKVPVEELIQVEINNESFMFFETNVEGKKVEELIPTILETIIKKLPIRKPMRWGTHDFEFVRPVHWLCVLYGDEIIPLEIFGAKASNQTFGHRFHAPGAFTIKHANNYETILQEKAYVIADFEKRKTVIREQIHQIANTENAIAVIDDDLIEEVTGLVEWPEALLIDFDESFLKVPEEALISAMQTHQKVFHLVNQAGELLPKFITVANIKSKEVKSVIIGNARVMNARLSDAKFFFETDCKIPLEERLEQLKSIVFQKQLGTIYERAERIAKLAGFIAKKLKLNVETAEKAGLLAKTDLVSNMVEEFPELQGTMGYYYAMNDELGDDIAMGIRGQYMPRFAEDNLPFTDYGCVISLADRLDKLVGIFGINQAPTGEKDPFALRRAAIGLLKIILEKNYTLDLQPLLEFAQNLYENRLSNKEVKSDVLKFIMERLKHWYQSKQTKIEFYNAVFEKNVTELNDFNLRLRAVKSFSELAEAASLAAANKRVSNILNKEKFDCAEINVSENLLQAPAEIKLAKLIKDKQTELKPLLEKRDYKDILENLADLREPIDNFFDEVMVMVDDANVKNNRIALLMALRNLFLEVADISKL